MKNLLPDLVIYEVRTLEYDTETEEIGEEKDSTYIVSPAPLRPDVILDISELYRYGLWVEIYEGRSATLQYHKGKLELEDVDTSTGYNGSPIWEEYFEALPDKPEETPLEPIEETVPQDAVILSDNDILLPEESD